MNDNRRFLLDDIVSMLPQSRNYGWLDTVNDEGLFQLWKDLVNLTQNDDGFIENDI